VDVLMVGANGLEPTLNPIVSSIISSNVERQSNAHWYSDAHVVLYGYALNSNLTVFQLLIIKIFLS